MISLNHRIYNDVHLNWADFKSVVIRNITTCDIELVME